MRVIHVPNVMIGSTDRRIAANATYVMHAMSFVSNAESAPSVRESKDATVAPPWRSATPSASNALSIRDSTVFNVKHGILRFSPGARNAESAKNA